jgi:choline-sulfatase
VTALRLAWLGLVLLDAAFLVARVRASGAVPRDEFAPAEAIYAAIPFLLAGGLLALAPLLLRPRAALAAARGEGGGGRPLATPAPGRIASAALSLAFLASAAGMLLGAAEVAFRVRGFVPRLVSPEDARGLLRATFGLGALLGIQVAACMAAGLVALALLFRTVTPRPSAVAVAASQALWFALFFALRASLGDPLDAIGLNAPVYLLGALLFLGLARVAQRRFEESGAPPSRDWLAHLGALATYALVPPFVRARGGTSLAAWATAGSAGGLFGLGLLLFPSLEDYRAELFNFFATLAVLVAMAGIGALAVLRIRRPSRGGWIAAGAVLAGALAAGAPAAREPTVRLVAREYSRMGNLVLDSPLARAIDPWKPIGWSEVEGALFDDAAPKRLPAAPAPLERIARERPLVVVVVLDALRADRVGRGLTPNLDAFAAQSVRFLRAYSCGTATTHGVRTLMTGRYATRYMLTPRHDPFFTKELAAAGYREFVVTVSGNDYNGVSGESFERGWNASAVRFTRVVTENRDALKQDAARVDAALRAIPSGPGVFAYVHLTGAHTPWRGAGAPPERYDFEVREVDRQFGRLLEGLAGREYVMVVTADHGTGLGEHGRIGGFFPYEEQIRVPLVLHVPGAAPREVSDMVASIDVAPTLVGLVEPGAPSRFHGRSLLPLLLGGTLPPRPIVAFSAFHDLYALLDGEGRWKLYHHRGRRYEALFDLERDPGERRNLVVEQAERAASMRALLAAFLWRGRDSYANPYHYREGP